MPQLEFVVGIGASAGGLESLERLFRNIPETSGIAFIVVQHLSPEHKSLMEELLTRFTRMPVEHPVDGMQLEANRVYVLSPGTELEIHDNLLAVVPRNADRALAFPVDRMLTSLASAFRDRAIAVILSGSGSDGSRGVRSIEAHGGLVLVEDPSFAAFDGMPRSAIETGTAVGVMSAESIAQALLEHAQTGKLPQGEDLAAVEQIIQLMRGELDVEFDEYKRGTIHRRAMRRASLRGFSDLTKYRDALVGDPEELRALQHDLLIGVTSFFRNPEAFEVLREAIETYVTSPIEPTRELRAWCAACATGEEAYSVAILFDEAIRRAGTPRTFKVFATDVHPDALERAAAGVYAPDRLVGVSAERLNDFFQPRTDGTFQVSQALRHRVVFARHDLLKDSPFTNLDVVTCRNMLIYLKIPAQHRAVASLCYGLRIGGALFLGSSESLGEFGPHFETISEPAKLYRKRVHSRGMKRPPIPTRVRSPSPAVENRSETRLLPTYDSLLELFIPPAFLITEQRTLVDSYGGAAKLLEIPERRPTGDFFELVPPSARTTLAALFVRAQRERTATIDVAWQRDGQPDRLYTATMQRVAPRNTEPTYVLSLVEHVAAVGAEAVASAPLSVAAQERTAHLEQELTQTRMSLQTTVEELEASNEELQATNEELVASNEELQSVNEELHSVNEELHTVNAEHQLKIGELTTLNRDIGHLLDSIDVATVYLDRELKIRKYTPRAADIFGLVEHDIGRYLASFNHQLHYPTLMDDVTAVRDHARSVEKEVRTRGDHWYFVRLLPYRVAGKIDGVVVTLVDATTLAQAKERARQLSSIVESNADAIISMKLDGTIASWNAAASRIYEYTADEAIGKSIMMLVPTAEQPAFHRILAQIAGGEEHVNVATTRLTKSGKLLEIAKTMSPIRDAERVVVGIATNDRDIHEQKELERRLRESERRYEDLYHHAPDSYLTVDIRSGRLTEVNDTFLRVTGYTREAVGGMHVLDLFPSSSRDWGHQFLNDVRSGKTLNDVRMEMARHDGTALDVALSASAVYSPGGEIVGARAVVRDASSRRQAEVEIQDATRMREQFLAMLSHELRGPLHAVAAAFEIIDRPGASPDAVARSEKVVRRQHRQIARLVDDLLDVSRILHGKLELQRSPVDLADVVRSSLDAVAPEFHTKGVRLSSDGFDVPLPMFGDAGRLAQVFANLLGNALRYTAPGQDVRVTCTRKGQACTISVIDHGRGIAPTDLGEIFDMFRQARQGIARSDGGLGLGLTIAQRIVNAHGGTITAESEGSGRGATFVVKLQLDERAAGVEDSPVETGNGTSIVIVEDQEDAREMMIELLQLAGHTVKGAGDGESGLELVLRERPRIALLDIGLPGLSGYEVAERVRAQLGTSTTLIALSGYGREDDIRAARAAGFDRHLTKPIDLKRFSAILRELLSD